MNLTDDMQRATRARALLADETLLAAKAEVERVIHDAWATAPIRDREGAHELKLMLKALSDVWALLEQAITDGKLAEIELDELNRRSLSPADFRAQFPTR
jgi:hypothetical protein